MLSHVRCGDVTVAGKSCDHRGHVINTEVRAECQPAPMMSTQSSVHVLCARS